MRPLVEMGDQRELLQGRGAGGGYFLEDLDCAEHVRGCWGLEAAKVYGHPQGFSGRHRNVQKQAGQVIKRTGVRLLGPLMSSSVKGGWMVVKTSARKQGRLTEGERTCRCLLRAAARGKPWLCAGDPQSPCPPL